MDDFQPIKKKRGKRKPRKDITEENVYCDMMLLKMHLRECVLIDYGIDIDAINNILVERKSFFGEISVLQVSSALFLVREDALKERLTRDVRGNFGALTFVDCSKDRNKPLLLDSTGRKQVTTQLLRFYTWLSTSESKRAPLSVDSANHLIVLAGWLLGYACIYVVSDTHSGNCLSMQPLTLFQGQVDFYDDSLQQNSNKLVAGMHERCTTRSDANLLEQGDRALVYRSTIFKEDQAARKHISMSLFAFSIPTEVLENVSLKVLMQTRVDAAQTGADAVFPGLVKSVAIYSSSVCLPTVGL